ASGQWSTGCGRHSAVETASGQRALVSVLGCLELSFRGLRKELWFRGGGGLAQLCSCARVSGGGGGGLCGGDWEWHSGGDGEWRWAESHTFLPSQPQIYHTVIMVKMVSYEAFACRCGAGDVVLRESYKHETRERTIRLLVGSPGASTTPIYSPGSSSTQFILQDLQHLHAIPLGAQHIQALHWELQEM
ncbi:hypothetical protein Tco_1026521, partial [Tanacetum coccineum]